MIKNFEDYTSELSDIEKEMLPKIIAGFKNYGVENPIKSAVIVARFNERNDKLKLNGARLRKIVNHIRANALLPLIATKEGYFVSYDAEIIKSQIESLRQRARSIERCANGLQYFTRKNNTVKDLFS